MHLSSVGIRGLRVDALVVDDVLEGSVHVAAVAAVVAVFARAVHQVLGAQVHQPPRGLGQLPLQGPRGAEGPAGATGALQWEQIIYYCVRDPRFHVCQRGEELKELWGPAGRFPGPRFN